MPKHKSKPLTGHKPSIEPEKPFESVPLLPPATANRLGLYLRELQQFQRAGEETIQSPALGSRLGLSDSQIRRDLALFGQFGKRGVGYNVSGLVGALRKALRTDGQWATVLFGLGNLGSALVRYRGFTQQGFLLKAIYESDARKTGQEVDGIPVLDIVSLEQTLPGFGANLAILALPADEAPAVAARLAVLGIEGILNFAPVALRVSQQTAIVDVDLAIELQRLAFAVANRERSR